MDAVAVPLRGASVASVLWKRVLSAAVLIPAVVWVVAGAPPWVFRGVAIGLSAVAAWELCRLFQQTGRLARPWLGATNWRGLAISKHICPPSASPTGSHVGPPNVM